MKRNEFLFVVVLVSLAAGLMSDIIRLPDYIDRLLDGTISKTILIIITLYGFSISPAVGLSATLLTAILIFRHNVSFVNNLQSSNPYIDTAFGPLYNYSFGTFVRNLFTPTTVDSKLVHQESAEYAEMIEPHPADGSYPSDESRPTNYESSLEYNYRPQDDTGSDDFTRFGPNIDEKLDVLHE